MQADIDTLLLDRVFQPAADRLSIGTNCFGLARLALLAAVLLQTIVLAADLLIFADPVMRALAGGITLLAFAGADQARGMIARVERQTRTGVMNVRRITLRRQRMAWLAVSLGSGATALARLDGATICAGLASLSWLAVIYFVSCSPAPPRFSVHRRAARGIGAVQFAV